MRQGFGRSVLVRSDLARNYDKVSVSRACYAISPWEVLCLQEIRMLQEDLEGIVQGNRCRTTWQRYGFL